MSAFLFMEGEILNHGAPPVEMIDEPCPIITPTRHIDGDFADFVHQNIIGPDLVAPSGRRPETERSISTVVLNQSE